MPAEVRRGGGSKGLECVVCGKVFNRLLKLKQHHRTHTGERPWGCTSCSKTFSRPAYLHNHRLSCHTPAHQQQFSCCKDIPTVCLCYATATMSCFHGQTVGKNHLMRKLSPSRCVSARVWFEEFPASPPGHPCYQQTFHM